MAAIPTLDAARAAATACPLVVVLNAGSGATEAQERLAHVRAALAGAGRPHDVLAVDDPGRLRHVAAEAVRRAQQIGAAVVAAGGDGTLNTVAEAVLPSGLPFGVLPQGTFNYFGRAHGLPTDLDEALQALLRAEPREVPVGRLNDRLILVNASLGLYPQLLEDREAFKSRFGRRRWVAMGAALMSALNEHRQCEIDVELAEARRRLRTTTLFVGVNPLQLAQLGIAQADEARAGRLVCVLVKPVGTRAMLGLALRGALGQLGEAMAVDSFAFDRLTVLPWQRWPRRRTPRSVKVAIDGEVMQLKPPLVFSRAERPLRLLVPPDLGAGGGTPADAAGPVA
jgi:diacylglycerol kinase family enzyme